VKIRIRKNVYGLILLFFILIAIVIWIQVVTTPKIEKFTEFYLLNAGGKAGDYPENVTLRESAEVILGIRNHEDREMGYRIVILLENETIETIEGIKLAHEEGWEKNVSLAPHRVENDTNFVFLLYKNGGEKPYRSLRLSIHKK